MSASTELPRICRLICVPVRDYDGRGGEEIVAERATHPWGGYIFFGGDAGAVRELTVRLREAAAETLLLASDLERGLGQQLRGGTVFPPPMALGAARDPALCREVGRATATEARAAGLNAVFAPVLDLAVEPANPIVCTRAFGDDPAAVAELGAAAIEGLQEGGVLATAKHFPGHGRTRRDSHDELPVVRADAAELADDLVPFRRAIEAGVALVMSAHVAYPKLEPSRTALRPATLSPAILQDLLRGELGFTGAVVSDALIMGAVADADPAALAAGALTAGVDCLLYPPDPGRVAEALAARLADGRLDRARVDDAGARLAAALARAGEPTGEALPQPAAADLARRAARAAVATWGMPAPARDGGRALVLVLLDGGVTRAEVVLDRVAAAPDREFRWLVPEEGPLALPEDLSDFTTVTLAWFSPIRAWKGRAGMSPAAHTLTSALFAARPDSSLISFSSPFILRELPPPRAALFAFGEAAACQTAIGEVLAGRGSPAGHLPVRV